MKSKLILTLVLSAFALTRSALGATPLDASSAPAPHYDDSVSLLGKTYTGLEFGYTHHVESAPRSLRRYGFVSSRAMIEHARNLDAAFRYNYTRGGATSLHDGAASFLAYFPSGDVTPFLRADLGWAWARGRGNSENGFMYLLGAGMEFIVKSRVALAPYVNYRDTPDLDDRAVMFGARATYRFDRLWNGTFAVQIDDEHNLEYAIGILRRF